MFTVLRQKALLLPLLSSFLLQGVLTSAAHADDDAYSLYRRGDWLKASKLFQAAVSRNYGDSRARYYLGDCYLHLGQTSQAAQQFTVCATTASDPAVLICSRSALSKLGFNFAPQSGMGSSVVPSQMARRADNPFESGGPAAPLLNRSSFQFSPIIGVSSGYVEPKEIMDQLIGLANLPAGSGIGGVAGAQGQRLDNQYLSKRSEILLRYENQLDQMRRDTVEQIRSTNDRATRDKSSVSKYIYFGNKRVANPDYASQINQIEMDAQAQVDSVNQKLNADAMDILASAQRETGQLDETHANIVSQVNAKGGISKMTSMGTGMYVRNFINFGGDDSDISGAGSGSGSTWVKPVAPQSLMAPPAMPLKGIPRGRKDKDDLNVWK